MLKQSGQPTFLAFMELVVEGFQCLGEFGCRLVAQGHTPAYQFFDGSLFQLSRRSWKGLPCSGFSQGLQAALRQSRMRSEEHTSELQSRPHLVCRLLLEKKKKNKI